MRTIENIFTWNHQSLMYFALYNKILGKFHRKKCVKQRKKNFNRKKRLTKFAA